MDELQPRGRVSMLETSVKMDIAGNVFFLMLHLNKLPTVSLNFVKILNDCTYCY